MAGTGRLSLADSPHHMLSKAHNGKQIFHEKVDYRLCLGQLHDLRSVYKVELHTWTLLPNRIHLVTTPHGYAQSLGTFFKALTCRAAPRRRNVHSERPPWEARFRASPTEPSSWLTACICYVQRLPVVHNLLVSAYHYENSSYRMRWASPTSTGRMPRRNTRDWEPA